MTTATAELVALGDGTAGRGVAAIGAGVVVALIGDEVPWVVAGVAVLVTAIVFAVAFTLGVDAAAAVDGVLGGMVATRLAAAVVVVLGAFVATAGADVD